jgi:hypothetical protein
LPARASRISSLKGLKTLLCVEITRILPPQIKQRVDRIEHTAHILVKRRLVDHDDALKAADVFRARRQRLDAVA